MGVASHRSFPGGMTGFVFSPPEDEGIEPENDDGLVQMIFQKSRGYPYSQVPAANLPGCSP